jgi:hypothetical protein
MQVINNSTFPADPVLYAANELKHEGSFRSVGAKMQVTPCCLNFVHFQYQQNFMSPTVGCQHGCGALFECICIRTHLFNTAARLAVCPTCHTVYPYGIMDRTYDAWFICIRHQRLRSLDMDKAW